MLPSPSHHTVPDRRLLRSLIALFLLSAAPPALAQPLDSAWEGPWRVEAAPPPSVDLDHSWVETVLIYTLGGVIFLVLVYTARHYVFTLSRLLGRQRHPYALVDTLDWPTVTVFIAAHNEEAVIGSSLENLLQVIHVSQESMNTNRGALCQGMWMRMGT